MRAVIICGGNVGEYITEYISEGDFIVCADSGYDSAVKFGIRPDMLIGDMDSVKSDYKHEKTVVYPTHKDCTDSEIVIQYVKKHGYDEVLLFGMIGTRMDHTLANLGLLKYFCNENAKIIDAHNEIFLSDGEIILHGKKSDTVSIIPFEGDLIGVTTENLEYPLYNHNILSGTSLGISNVMTDEICKINIKEGKAFIIKSKD